MPELPEVESAKRSLQRVIRGKVIASVEVRSPSAVRTHRPQAFADALAGQRIERVSRRGKTLLFQLSGGRTLICHFTLWGALRFGRPAGPPAAQTAAVIDVAD